MPLIDTNELRKRYRVSDVVGRRTKLKKAGREFVGLCPFHQEKTPSFTVVDARGFAHCFGCGWNGDIIRFVMATEYKTFVEACEMIAGGDLPVVPEIERVKAAEEDAAAKAAAISIAWDVWSKSIALPGTLARTYLLSRGITIEPPRFRFVATPAWYDHATGECGPDRPALVCLITDANEQFLGIQRIFLAADGKDKAGDMRNPKLSLGRPSGGAIRIGEIVDGHVTVVEGPEDGASVAQELRAARRDGAVWIACGTSMLPIMQFPPEISRVTVGGDNNKAGRAAAQKTKAAYQDRGLEVRAVYPDAAFGDWNDQLQGKRK